MPAKVGIFRAKKEKGGSGAILRMEGDRFRGGVAPVEVDNLSENCSNRQGSKAVPENVVDRSVVTSRAPQSKAARPSSARLSSKREGEVKIQDSAVRPGVGVGTSRITRNKLERGGEPLKSRIFDLREFSELPRSGLVQRPGAHRRRPRRDDDTTRSTVTQRSASGASAKHGQCSNDTNSCRPER